MLSVLLPDFSETELKACIDEAYGTQWSDEKITPVKPLGDDYVMELFNGPTSAFKDVALQILPRFMARTTPAGGDGNEKIMIVTAPPETPARRRSLVSRMPRAQASPCSIRKARLARYRNCR